MTTIHGDSIVGSIIKNEEPILEIRRYGIFEVNRKFVILGLESKEYFHQSSTLQEAVTWLVDMIAPRNER